MPDSCVGGSAQVVKVRVEAVDAARKRLRLGLVARKAAGGEDGEAAQDELGALQPGDIVQGTVLKSEMKPVCSLVQM